MQEWEWRKICSHIHILPFLKYPCHWDFLRKVHLQIHSKGQPDLLRDNTDLRMETALWCKVLVCRERKVPGYITGKRIVFRLPENIL